MATMSQDRQAAALERMADCLEKILAHMEKPAEVLAPLVVAPSPAMGKPKEK